MIDNKIIVLGGIGRSGTTILSKLIGSCKDVEFFYEPKTIDLLFSLIHEMKVDHWKLLFKRNVYDDLLLNSLAGRVINTNKNDDSSIYNYKGEDEINKRLSKSFGQLEIEPIAKKKIIAFKLLNNILGASTAKEYFPNLSTLFIIRNPNDTINSLMQKGWYSNDALSIASPEPASLFTVFGDLRIPNFVVTEDTEEWVAYTELERYAYYYIFMLENLEKFISNESVFIDYDDFAINTTKVFNRILDHYRLNKGEKTDNILSTVQVQYKQRADLLNEIPENMRVRIEELYTTFKKLT